jgi:hypothetical protein
MTTKKTSRKKLVVWEKRFKVITLFVVGMSLLSFARGYSKQAIAELIIAFFLFFFAFLLHEKHQFRKVKPHIDQHWNKYINAIKKESPIVPILLTNCILRLTNFESKFKNSFKQLAEECGGEYSEVGLFMLHGWTVVHALGGTTGVNHEEANSFYESFLHFMCSELSIPKNAVFDLNISFDFMIKLYSRRWDEKDELFLFGVMKNILGAPCILQDKALADRITKHLAASIKKADKIFKNAKN